MAFLLLKMKTKIFCGVLFAMLFFVAVVVIFDMLFNLSPTASSSTTQERSQEQNSNFLDITFGGWWKDKEKYFQFSRNVNNDRRHYVTGVSQISNRTNIINIIGT